MTIQPLGSPAIAVPGLGNATSGAVSGEDLAKLKMVTFAELGIHLRRLYEQGRRMVTSQTNVAEQFGQRRRMALLAVVAVVVASHWLLGTAAAMASGVMALVVMALVVTAMSAPFGGGRVGGAEVQASRTGSGDARGPRQAAPAAASVIQALGDPALTLNRHFDVLDANGAAEDVFGRIRIGQHISHTTRNPELATAVVDAVRQQQRKTFAVEIRTPLERHLEGVAAPLEADPSSDDAAVVLVYLRDLTEQDRLSAMRADFVANASHELRTPLASLKGFIETMRGPARADLAAHERFLDIMNQQAERMTRLIDDLLSLSRIEMRAHIPPSAVVNLNEIATSVVASLEPQARIAGAVVTVQTLAHAATVRGDHDELVQAVQNLVQNAIKYGRISGRVEVRITDEPGGRRTLAVVDDGAGIAPEHLPRLTERFYRVNVASSRDRGGTGLGLAIVKHIVTRHRGTLSISSQQGKGSTFRITLPAA